MSTRHISNTQQGQNQKSLLQRPIFGAKICMYTCHKYIRYIYLFSLALSLMPHSYNIYYMLLNVLGGISISNLLSLTCMEYNFLTVLNWRYGACTPQLHALIDAPQLHALIDTPAVSIIFLCYYCDSSVSSQFHSSYQLITLKTAKEAPPAESMSYSRCEVAHHGRKHVIQPM